MGVKSLNKPWQMSSVAISANHSKDCAWFWTKQNIMSMLAQVRDQAFLECLFAKTDKIDPFLMMIFGLYRREYIVMYVMLIFNLFSSRWKYINKYKEAQNICHKWMEKEQYNRPSQIGSNATSYTRLSIGDYWSLIFLWGKIPKRAELNKGLLVAFWSCTFSG